MEKKKQVFQFANLFKNPFKTKKKLREVCPDSCFTSIIPEYPTESYEIETEDKRILKLFRVQAKNTEIKEGKKVIFLQHGLFDSADNWVINGDDNSLALFLANKGYDIFIGNTRGNKYSLKTSDPNIKDEDFWDYSFQEMAEYDVPANIKFVLSLTKMQKLSWIGHSQGTTQMFAALTDTKTREFVNSSIDILIALAPIVYLANQQNPLLQFIAKGSNGLESMAKTFGMHSIMNGNIMEESPKEEKDVPLLAKPFCSMLLSVSDSDPEYNNIERMGYFSKHFPSGDSMKCLYHYKQFVVMKKNALRFEKYDYGKSKNKVRYGSEIPPEYDLSFIKVPVTLHVGVDDKLGNVKDSAILQNELIKKGVDVKYYGYNDCGHMTFMWGRNPVDVFRNVLSDIAGKGI